MSVTAVYILPGLTAHDVIMTHDVLCAEPDGEAVQPKAHLLRVLSSILLSLFRCCLYF